MMPLLFICFIIIVIKSLSLDGAMAGVRYILEPRLDDISVKGILFALRQSFFTLSLGTTGMITYASYASKEMTIKTSAISIVIMNILVSVLELNVSNFTKNDNTKRKKVAVIGSILVFLLSIPATLSFGSLSHIQFGAGSIFDNMDFLVSNILMPLGALGTTLVVGHLLKIEELKAHFGRDKFKLFIPWYLLIKFVLPVVIVVIFIVQFI